LYLHAIYTNGILKGIVKPSRGNNFGRVFSGLKKFFALKAFRINSPRGKLAAQAKKKNKIVNPFVA
jgi:hypothetical protein